MFSDAEASVSEAAQTYATNLYQHTPLTRRQSEVLALRRDGYSAGEISDTFGMSTNTVENQLSDITTVFEECTNLLAQVGTQTLDSDDTGSMWVKVSEATIPGDVEQTELQLYRGVPDGMGYDAYLLVEKTVTQTTEFETKVTQRRGQYRENALRNGIFSRSDSLEEYCARQHLLEYGGVDPIATGTPAPSFVLHADEFTQEEIDAALEETEAWARKVDSQDHFK